MLTTNNYIYKIFSINFNNNSYKIIRNFFKYNCSKKCTCNINNNNYY